MSKPRSSRDPDESAAGLSRAEAEWAIGDILRRLVFGMDPTLIEPELLGAIASAVTTQQLHAVSRRVVRELTIDTRVEGLQEPVDSSEPFRFVEIETKGGRAWVPDPSQSRPVDVDARFDSAVQALASAVASLRASRPRIGDAKVLKKALQRCFPRQGATDAIRSLAQDPWTVTEKLRELGGLPDAPAIDDIEIDGIVSQPGKVIGGVIVVLVPPDVRREIKVSAIRDAYSRPNRKSRRKS